VEATIMLDPHVPENLKALIANLEHREAELASEEATLPTRGVHREQWLKVSKELRRVRKALRDHRAELQSQIETEAEYQAAMAKLREGCTPEQWAYIEEMSALYEKEHPPEDGKAARRREAIAEERREGFQLIIGGKYDGSVY
jgi:hypothetical protein